MNEEVVDPSHESESDSSIANNLTETLYEENSEGSSKDGNDEDSTQDIDIVADGKNLSGASKVASVPRKKGVESTSKSNLRWEPRH